MNQTLEIIEVGDALGFVLTEEMLAVLKVKEGGHVWLCERQDGFHLTAEGGDNCDSEAQENK